MPDDGAAATPRVVLVPIPVFSATPPATGFIPGHNNKDSV